MIKTLNISYGASNDKTISASEFEVEIYDEIENSLKCIIGVVSERISLKNLKSINIEIKEISTIEEEDEDDD